MSRTILIALTLCAIICVGLCLAAGLCAGLCTSLGAAAGTQQLSAAALEQLLERSCRGVDLWPGFDPLAVPLAVFDGDSTFLFRHPAPPTEFSAREGFSVCAGRHPSVIANTSTPIGGVPTATVMLESLRAGKTPEECAALVAHEAFHVFQGTTGRRWGANEADLFTYPVDDARLLALRRLEAEALARSFDAASDEAARGWACCALGLRRERFAGLGEAYRAYERGVEGMEGTATYVECKVAGRTRPSFPAGGFGAEEVRGPAYTTGVAWALLLDRFGPDWRAGFAAHDSLSLDELLARALDGCPEPQGAQFFSAAEREAAERAAGADAKRVLELRAERRKEYESRPGWRVIVVANDANPLWPQGFDPLNVKRVEGGVLHTRFVRLGNDAATLEVMNRASLTDEVGPHPLFNGVRRLLVAGIEDEPSVDRDGDKVTVTAAGLRAEFARASVERRAKEILIRL